MSAGVGEVRTANLGGEVERRGLLAMNPVVAAAWVVAFALGAISFLMVQGMVGGLLGIGVFMLVIWLTRSTDERSSFGERKLYAFRSRMRRKRGEHIFWSATDRGEVTGIPAPHYDPAADPSWVHPVPLGRVEALPLEGTGFDPLFILRHSNPGEVGYLSVTLAVEGVKGGLQSNSSYAGVWRAFGYVQSELAKSGSFIRGIQLLHRSVPADITPHINWYRDRILGDPSGRLAILAANYDEVIDQIRPLAEEHRVFVTVKIPLTSEFFREASTRDDFGGVRRAEVGWASLVKDELERLERLLGGAGWGKVHVLGERRTAALVRSLMNPDYALDDDRDVDWKTCWQSYIGGEESVVVAGKWHTRVAQVPPGAIAPAELGPLWLQPLLVGVEADEGREDLPRASTIRTVVARLDFVPDAMARVEATKDMTQDVSSKIRERQKGKISDGTTEVMLTASQRRNQDLAPGSGIHGSAYSLTVSVTGRDEEDLRRACLRVEHAAGSSVINKLNWQDDWHDVAQVATWPLCRGMAGTKAARTA
ncbi:hypothetical protein GS538_09085 [Rhodococcus hoagii]|nr:hypothetical protein [Prescottella equi]